MDKFGGLMLIDSLVKLYPVYTHDAIFRMEVKEAYTYLIINRTEASIQSEANEIRRRLTKKH